MIDGWHKAKATAWGLAGGADGKPEQYAIAFEVVEGECKGETMTWFGGFGSDAATDYTNKNLRRAGWDGHDITKVELPNRVVSIKVETEEYNGKVRQKIATIGNGGGGFKKMDDSQAQSAAARLNKALAASDKRIAGPPIQQQPPAGWGTNRKQAPQQREPGDDDYDANFP